MTAMTRKHSLDDAFSRANTLRDRFGSLSRPSLECLDLTCRNLADADCESVRHVCTASLRALRLGGNKLTGEGVRKLTPSLRLAPNLRELWLGNNALGDEGVRTLAGELHHLPALGELWLCGVGMGDAGAQALAEAVVAHPPQALSWLLLNNNTIGNEGARGLAGALSSLPKLEMLSLRSDALVAQRA